MLSPSEFVIRDLVDIYNLYRSGLLEPMQNREVLRVVALAWMGMKDLGVQFSRKNLWPSEELIKDHAIKLGVSEEVVNDILEVNRGVQEIVFPSEADKSSRLFLKDQEEAFLFELNGITRGELAHERRFVRPRINWQLLKQAAPEAFKIFPDLETNFEREYELQQRVLEATREQSFQSF